VVHFGKQVVQATGCFSDIFKFQDMGSKLLR